jgi:uncharacterized repeat protein (TIGR03803 family)
VDSHVCEAQPGFRLGRPPPAGTAAGGANDQGTVFKIAPNGSLTALYGFCSESGSTDGSDPEAGLIQATDGNLYGATEFGGTYSQGTVFGLSLPPPPAE